MISGTALSIIYLEQKWKLIFVIKDFLDNFKYLQIIFSFKILLIINFNLYHFFDLFFELFLSSLCPLTDKLHNFFTVSENSWAKSFCSCPIGSFSISMKWGNWLLLLLSCWVSSLMVCYFYCSWVLKFLFSYSICFLNE